MIILILWWTIIYFYPRPPRGGRLFVTPDTVPVVIISIHALHEEGDGPPR